MADREKPPISEKEAAFYRGAVWGHREARQHDGPLRGADICDEFLRCYPDADAPPSPTPETET